MKKCIWCSKTEKIVVFEKLAHTFPQSMGGKNVCENVCDDCNRFFGNKESGFPAVEIALKEVLNLSRFLLLSQEKDLKVVGRFKSEYFNFNPNNRSIKFKAKYQLRRGFQDEFGKRFRRGMFKVFLEERERQIGDGHDDRFNFIREFARYNFNDYPIYFQRPKFGIVFYNIDDVKNPEIRFTEHSNEIDNSYRFYSYPLNGHSFSIPTSNQFMPERLRSYRDFLQSTDNPFGTELIEIKQVEDLDFRFNYMNK